MTDAIVRPDHRVIASLIPHGARVLDLGCGDGTLMNYLEKNNGVKVQGIELDEQAIYACVEKGLSVYHSDIDTGLKSYPDKSFEFVILNQSMQQVKRIDYVIEEALRVGEQVIVGFPNFANISARVKLFFGGRAPVTGSLPNQWYNSPNIRFLSISDFVAFCRAFGITVRSAHCLGEKGNVCLFPNLFARNAVFVITR